jgi:hypothetical protein
MRKIAIVATSLLLSTSALAQGNGADSFAWDISFFSFQNHCTGEFVRPNPGETIRAVLRLDATGNILHFINSANGQVSGYGVQSQSRYSLTVGMSFVPNVARRANIVDGNGAAEFSGFTQIVSNDHPGSGISRTHFRVKVVLRDGVGEVVHLEPFTAECANGS